MGPLLQKHFVRVNIRLKRVKQLSPRKVPTSEVAERLYFSGRSWEGHNFSGAVKSLRICPRFSA